MFIEIKNLSKIYNKYLAVDKINFHLEKDKTIGLLGPNGCGKTTTIGMMLGLVTPSSGEILIENNIVPENFVLNNYVLKQNDPIHLNDVEPTFQDTKYWDKDDLFISLRDQNMIIHF